MLNVEKIPFYDTSSTPRIDAVESIGVAQNAGSARRLRVASACDQRGWFVRVGGSVCLRTAVPGGAGSKGTGGRCPQTERKPTWNSSLTLNSLQCHWLNSAPCAAGPMPAFCARMPRRPRAQAHSRPLRTSIGRSDCGSVRCASASKAESETLSAASRGPVHGCRNEVSLSTPTDSPPPAVHAQPLRRSHACPASAPATSHPGRRRGLPSPLA